MIIFLIENLSKKICSEYALLNLILGENLCEVKNNDFEKKSLIKRIKDYDYQLTIQTIFSVSSYFILFLPTILVYKLYEVPWKTPRFITFPVSLYLVLLEGCQLAYNIAHESCGKKKKVSVYSIWFFMNISVVLFYCYFLSTTSIYGIDFHRIRPEEVTVVDLMWPQIVTVIDVIWPQALIIVKYLSLPKSTTADMAIKSNKEVLTNDLDNYDSI